MPVSDAIATAMRQTNELFVVEVGSKRNVAALDKVYTIGARILPPGASMIEGRENIKAFWAQAVVALDVKSCTLASVNAEMAGDTVVEIGRAEIVTNGGATVAVKYVVHWKQEDGVWKWNTDIWNLNS
jgi:ketosteroid isomerase-like protein